MKFRFNLLAILLLTTSFILHGQEYLGQTTPSFTPEIFGIQIISTGMRERDITISPDGSEIYFTVFNAGFDGNIYFVKLENGVWSLPEIAPFSGNRKDLEPAFAPDGNRLFFSSKRDGADYDIYYVERTNGGPWSDPIDVGDNVNTSVNEFYPSITNDGTLYYTAAYDGGVGGEDIWRSRLVDNEYQSPSPVGVISTTADEFNAFIDPQERYIYFGSFGRSDGLGGGDIYFSRRQGNSWSTPENLGSPVNTNRLDYSPFVSPDGLYLFFTSERGQSASGSNNPFDISAVVNKLLSPGPAGSDIYWKRR